MLDGIGSNGEERDDAVASMRDVEIADPRRVEQWMRGFEPSGRGIQIRPHEG